MCVRAYGCPWLLVSQFLKYKDLKKKLKSLPAVDGDNIEKLEAGTTENAVAGVYSSTLVCIAEDG